MAALAFSGCIGGGSIRSTSVYIVNSVKDAPVHMRQIGPAAGCCSCPPSWPGLGGQFEYGVLALLTIDHGRKVP